MMKKYLLLTISLGVLCSASFAASSNSKTLDKIENSIFGFKYNNESISSRLNRIENSVYGKVSSKSEAERIAKLNTDLSASEMGNEIPPVEDTFAENSDYIVEEEPQETSDVSYPVIDEMERQIFKQTSPKEKIQNRLAKLEQKAFNKTYTDDLNTRVERLKAELKPQSFMDNKMAQSYNTFYDDYVEPADSSYRLDQYAPTNFDYDYYNSKLNDYDDYSYSTPYNSTAKPTKKASISSIEKKLYRKSFTNESTEKRLARLENSMFGTQFSQDDAQTRIDRVASAYQAEKSSGKYDSNKFSQNLATAMQIGTIILMVLACIL